MPTIDTDSLIKEYFNKVKGKYPDLSYEQFEKICKSSFYYIKSQIEKEEMPTILVKYLGKFEVFSGKLKTLLRENDDSLHFKVISPEKHAAKKEFLIKKLEEIKKGEEPHLIHEP